MKGKRAKQYRKLMHQYELAFNFREPYQVLVDAEMIQDTTRFRMDMPKLLERTLHGQIKPMITQCSIRHLYTSKHENRAEKSAWIETAKTFERRRCGHHELEEPLSTKECLLSVVDAKDTGTNKHRYIVASQDGELRARMRRIAGVPLVYVQRSVMVMEPMAAKTEQVKRGMETEKIRSGVTRGRGPVEIGEKRKRDDEEKEGDAAGGIATGIDAQPELKKRKKKGPKAPNPLSTKKPKKRDAYEAGQDNEGGAGRSKQPLPDRMARQLQAARQQAEDERKQQNGALAPEKKRRRERDADKGPSLAAAPLVAVGGDDT